MLKVDVDECEEAAMEYNIQSMPTFVFIKSKKEVMFKYFCEITCLTIFNIIVISICIHIIIFRFFGFLALTKIN